ncbi:membrane protease YdiL (CAAX protease family) [Weissella uvarum]|uniref:CPBP family intramembrane glutamic endopeptidase n=1 Tax=Weissella uvarum TaxID=1479233 RepID=UPI00196079F9|nr:type II CAAX endopeptidase family protein [Weissella uvarum]MBM7617740.1 membrane protease YdiL (CAAX protease family) [Weissella uvarum]MCM0595881.1 CPBP family intramembrane metalloprotease [Weissella uvarum]
MQTKLKTIDYAFQGFFWLIIGVVLDFAIQVFGVSASRGLALAFHFPQNGWVATLCMVIVVLIFMTIAVAVLLYAIRRVNPKVGLHRPQVSKIMWIFYGYALIILGTMALTLVRLGLTGQVPQAKNQQMIEQLAHQGTFGLTFTIILAVVVAPVVEELIFRGVVLNYFFKNSAWWLNVFISAGLFGYFHVYSAFNIFDFLQYSLLGLILAYVYKHTHQIQYAMGLHFLNNAISIGLMVITIMS